MKYAVLFPGQGSQSVGMCADVRAAHPELCGARANEVLGWDLDSLVSNGPGELLTQTQHAQPALFAVSFALWTEFSSRISNPPSAAAGHSLGEYTALAAAGVLSYIDGLRLVSERGRAMATAAKLEPSGMAALLGADLDLVESIVSDRRRAGGRLSVANINAPGQIVIAGGEDDLDWLDANARDLGVRRVIKLKVAGAFHSPFMAPAAKSLAAELEAAQFAEGDFPVFANATAAPTLDPEATLAQQLTAPVRFAETLEHIAASGVDTFVHIGPGDVTIGLVKRTVGDANVRVVSSIEDARAVAGELSVH
ncbi:MAG: ACP S-malonyltransferase [Actinomycetota bacterium]|nr:ACP S-malonyltransferase [Actinomycetota bacterium]MDK1016790.1 ACP S-malonyltransferase [Actinomycetota bacterium]MDK1026505.1 ACP S-malonyltransferase [Actinomycetota bacterium]MDK1037981.1 ACP S-malonyltransferase [Actinomycetota bacterium]MDK1096065.1 ACP S-malonyltransferase [Actinomycetota bacterium]